MRRELKDNSESENDGLACMSNILQGLNVRVDMTNSRSYIPPPEWFDLEKFQLGQLFAMKHFSTLCFAEVCSLILLFSVPGSLDALIFTNKSSTPYTVYTRYVTTIDKVRSWYTDNIWDPKTPGGQNIMKVRAMHSKVRDQMSNCPKQILQFKMSIKNPCCPMLKFVEEDSQNSFEEPGSTLKNLILSLNSRTDFFSQLAMSFTLFSFIGMAVLHPKKYGIICTDEEMESFVHLWASIGYLLGIEDQYNVCLGGLHKCKEQLNTMFNYMIKPSFRTVEPSWEHMSRSLINGIKFYSPLSFIVNFEAILCYLFLFVLDIPMPLCSKVISWPSHVIAWINYVLLTYFVPYLPGFRNLMNQQTSLHINKALKTSPEKLHKIRMYSDEYMRKFANAKTDYKTKSKRG